MSQAISDQHPAVVLRSHYNHMRALLAVAMIAVVGLAAAVVIVATQDDSGTTSVVSAPATLGYHDEGTADVASPGVRTSDVRSPYHDEGTADVTPGLGR